MRYALIAEPDSARASAYKALVEEERLSGVLVNDGPAARAVLAERGAPVLVVLELGLPKVDGLEFLSEMRRSFPGAPIHVVAMSESLKLRNAAMAARSDLGISTVLARSSPMWAVYDAIRKALHGTEPPRAAPGAKPEAKGSPSTPPIATQAYAELILNHAIEGTVLIDEKGRVVHVNATAAQMAGLPVSVLTGITVDELVVKSSTFFLDPRPFQEYVRGLRRKGPVSAICDLEVHRPRRRVIRWALRPVELSGGIGHLCCYVDVTAEVDALRRQQATMAAATAGRPPPLPKSKAPLS